jgi:hypothetical protein
MKIKIFFEKVKKWKYYINFWYFQFKIQHHLKIPIFISDEIPFAGTNEEYAEYLKKKSDTYCILGFCWKDNSGIYILKSAGIITKLFVLFHEAGHAVVNKRKEENSEIKAYLFGWYFIKKLNCNVISKKEWKQWSFQTSTDLN